jgi:hypothetical protein
MKNQSFLSLNHRLSGLIKKHGLQDSSPADGSLLGVAPNGSSEMYIGLCFKIATLLEEAPEKITEADLREYLEMKESVSMYCADIDWVLSKM